MKMQILFEIVEKNLPAIDKNSIFVEIGSDRGEGSTLLLADLAVKSGTKLLTVDIDPLHISDKWNYWYRDVRVPTWPEHIESFNDAPDYIQKSLIENNNYLDIKDSFSKFDENYLRLKNHPAITWYTEIGSEWAKSFNEKIGKKISLLFLDNFDFIYAGCELDDHTEKAIWRYQKNFNIDMNNQACQIEHLKQLIFLFPHLANDCIVVADDTFLHNGCWVGKCGPGVVYLLANDFELFQSEPGTVILKRLRSDYEPTQYL